MNHLTPLYCHRCDALIGRCNDTTLVLGGARIYHQTTLYCIEQTCGTRFVWRPVRVYEKIEVEVRV